MVKGEKKELTPVTRVYTINLHRLLKDHHGKFQAPRAIREIKKFAQKEMKTTVVQIKPNLNTRLWEKGVRNVPNRIRVKISREPKKADDETSDEQFISVCDYQDPEDGSFKGLATVKKEI